MFSWFKKNLCEHEFRVNYFEQYNDTSSGGEIPSILFSAYCVRCKRPAVCYNSKNMPGCDSKESTQFVYGCDISTKEELIKELRIK